MSESEKYVQIILNIGADGRLSQAEADALFAELETQVGGKMAGSVDIISKKSTDESLTKGEPVITLAVVVLQYVVPKLIEVVYDMVKEHRGSQVKAFAKVGGEQITIDSHTEPADFQVIQDRVQAANASQEVHDRRYALLIGTTSYQDSRLNKLASPEVDIRALADTLRDPTIGAYDDVNLLLNQSSSAILQAVEQFFKRRANTDLLLLYFSGHGVRGNHDKLYLAAENTNLELLNSTALSSDFIKDAMDSSKSERQVLILDCCYSGSFLHGTKATTVGDQVFAASAFKGNGFGRVIMTATDKTQVAWEGQRVTGQVQKSVFTEHLIEGLKSGEADHDRDGWVGLEELYKYVYNRMVKTTRDQTPEINVFNMKGSIILARNPRPQPMALPSELQALIDHSYPDVRVTAVSRLSQLFNSSQYGMALAARKALEKLAGDDSSMVSEAARRALGLIPSETHEEISELPPQPQVSESLLGADPVEQAPVEPDRSVSDTQPAHPQPQTDSPAQPFAWWTKIKPPPGTRSDSVAKSGPTLVGDISPTINNNVYAPTSLIPEDQTSTKPSSTSYSTFQNTSAEEIGIFREHDTFARIAGLLTLLLFFPPVTIWGFLVSLRAIKASPSNPRGIAGFVLSCIALAIQLILLIIISS